MGGNGMGQEDEQASGWISPGREWRQETALGLDLTPVPGSVGSDLGCLGLHQQL